MRVTKTSWGDPRGYRGSVGAEESIFRGRVLSYVILTQTKCPRVNHVKTALFNGSTKTPPDAHRVRHTLGEWKSGVPACCGGATELCLRRD
jgi:hypothetical protein